jgi:ubiquinone/menaquinone biosynthesis C-methylase UbiE
MNNRLPFIPALHFRWLTRWYDPILRCVYPEAVCKSALIAQAHLQPGEEVLDVGCGTGTLILLIKGRHPEVSVVGLDIDSAVLDLARSKAEQAGQTFVLQQGTATALPYAEGRFDRVFASLMLHHLTGEDKRRAIGEMFRVLRPGGELHVADFGKPHDPAMWLISLLTRWAEELHDNILGQLPVFMVRAGFRPVEETVRYRTMTGALVLYRACKPGKEVP